MAKPNEAFDASKLWEHPGFREAMRDFMKGGLWGNERRLSLYRATMTSIWRDFKSEANYEELRQRLSEQARAAAKE